MSLHSPSTSVIQQSLGFQRARSPAAAILRRRRPSTAASASAPPARRLAGGPPLAGPREGLRHPRRGPAFRRTSLRVQPARTLPARATAARIRPRTDRTRKSSSFPVGSTVVPRRCAWTGGEAILYFRARDSVLSVRKPRVEPESARGPRLARCKECVLFESQTIDQPAVGHANVVVRDGVIKRYVGNQDTTFRHAHR